MKLVAFSGAIRDDVWHEGRGALDTMRKQNRAGQFIIHKECGQATLDHFGRRQLGDIRIATIQRPVNWHIAIQDIFRFATSAKASAYWDKIRTVYDLDVAAELRYRSRYADDEASGCGINRIPICRVVTRYHNMVSVWYFTLDDGIKDYSAGLFLEEVDQVLSVADEHIGTSLQLTPHQ